MILQLKDYVPTRVDHNPEKDSLIVRGESGVEISVHKHEDRYTVVVFYADDSSSFFSGKPGGDEQRLYDEAWAMYQQTKGATK